jgi:DNA-binding NarL/FixJ family response regulator
MVSSVSNPGIIKKITSYNPEGFLTKTTGLSELADCFNALRKKQSYISPYLKQILEEPSEKSLLDSFTPKEMEVLDKLAKGENIEEMAISLNISRNTVIVHRRNMMAKTGSKSVTALLALAVRAGIITASEPDS